MSASKKGKLGALLNKKDSSVSQGFEAKQEIIHANKNGNVSPNASINANITPFVPDDAISKINQYKTQAKRKTEQLSHSEMFDQQNVYIDKNLISAIKQVLKKNKKLTKQDLFNNALKMYLDIAFDIQVDLLSEQNKDK